MEKIVRFNWILVLTIVYFNCIYKTYATLDGFQPLVSSNSDYEYVLPQRKVTSCPSFASFKFSCQTNHLLSIESLVFSQVYVDEYGECVSDWTAECRDESDALAYVIKECSGQESCSLFSYQLRSRTKCNFHQVISVYYKCIPTFEVVNVPVKCDICKNVTVNNMHENYGFIHSAWYPKLYPRVTCHSVIKNKPEHFIIIYSVSGSIGLDRIQIESVNQQGILVVKETLTGNLTTKLVLASSFDINVTVITADTYYQEQRKFLLYFYIVPKCSVILCSNVTSYPYDTGVYYPTIMTTSYSTQPSIPYYPIQSTLTTITTTNTTKEANTTTQIQSTYAPPLRGDSHHSSKISDAWLAAILALIYALLMVFAVLAAIYCRRRRRQRLVQENIIFSPSAISSSQIINPMSRAHSQISLKNEINLPISSASYLTSANKSLDQSTLYSHINRENYSISQNMEECMFDRIQQSSQIPTHIRQINYNTNFNEFDNYSQVITEEDTLSGYNTSNFMQYGADFDTKENYNRHHQVQHNHHYQQHHEEYNQNINHGYTTESSYQSSTRPSASIELTSVNYPASNYSMKTNTQHGSILAQSVTGASDLNTKNMYRAVEFTKSPILERVRVKNLEETNDFDEFDSNQMEEICQRAFNIDTRGHSVVTTTENRSYRKDVRDDEIVTEDEKTFVVKLFPLDGHENEVQEMSMYVENRS